MTAAYMPFTYLPEATAHLLEALVGPATLYQPCLAAIPETLRALDSRGTINIRTPLTGDEERLCTALKEFTDWARMNPGKVTPGSAFYGLRQGEIPFSDENATHRLRSAIQGYPGPPASSPETEAIFIARLFLMVAQENDLASERLAADLRRFTTLEQTLLTHLSDVDEVGFARRRTGGTVWAEDPGAKRTEERLRAWATLAAADADPPGLWVTTSAEVMETLMDRFEHRLALCRLTRVEVALPPVVGPPQMVQLLADLGARPHLAAEALAPLERLAGGTTGGPKATLTLFAAPHPPVTILGQLAMVTRVETVAPALAQRAGHTLIVLVEE